MRLITILLLTFGLALALAFLPRWAADYPAPNEGDWPEWLNGNYTKQPRSAQFASVFYGIASSGGNQALYKTAPTREKADQLPNQRLGASFSADANGVLDQWGSSRDYNPSAGLERIQAVLLAINSADDERNPPELGVLDREIKRVKSGRVLLLPASDQTAGHGTTFQARFWKGPRGIAANCATRSEVSCRT